MEDAMEFDTPELEIEPESLLSSESEPVPEEDRRETNAENLYKRSIFSIPVEVHVTIGTARPTIAELLQMKRDSLIQLSSKIDDPVELYVGNKVIARGELIEADGGAGTIGVRLTEIVDMSEETLA